MALPEIFVRVRAKVGDAVSGLGRVQGELRETGDAAQEASRQTTRLGTHMARNTGRSSGFARGIQNASFQLGDFATQVGAGTNASIALGQQLPQLLGGFGVLGAVMGAVVAIGVPLTRVFMRLGESGRDMATIFGTLEPVVRKIQSAFSAMADIGVQAAELIINNLDRILITAGTVAAFFAGKFVAGFVAARIATFSLAGALGVLRTALIRTGIGAAFIAAGELVYQFSRLVAATGGFGKALGVVGEVFSEVWERMKQGASLLAELFQGAAMVVKGAFQSAFAAIAQAFNDNVLVPVTSGINTLIGAVNQLGGNLSQIPLPTLGEGLAQSGAYNIEGGGAIMGSAGGQLGGLLGGPLESITKMRDLLASMKEDGLTLPDILGTKPMEEGGGKGKKTQAEEAIENQTAALGVLRDAGTKTYQALGNFVQQFASKSKAAAIAAIAIQKGLSISQIIANTAAAQMRALAELGPIAGPPVAAKIGAYGKLQAALVAATGLAQATGGGGAGGSGGGGGGGVGGLLNSAQQSQEPERVSEIRFFGNLGASGEQLVNLINEEFDRGNRVRAVVG